MRFRHVCVEALAYLLPADVVRSAEIEQRLEPVYERLGLPAGRLEMMTGIRERRFFPPGTRPGTVSAQTVRQLMQVSGFDARYIGALLHGSVCRDQLEPATANAVHLAAGLPAHCLILDVSNACLGLLNGMVILANMIESGQIRAGIVTGTEVGRSLVEATIDALLSDPDVTRQDVKLAFASLTIGSGSAAILLCDRRLSRTGNRLLGGSFLSDTASHLLCAGGDTTTENANDGPQMRTDSEALLHAGVELAERAWTSARNTLGWSNADVDKVFTHQVGQAHRKLLLKRLGLTESCDFPTVEFLGNTGAVALPVTAALGIERGHLVAGDQVALLGIGSGLNALMLGIDWQTNPAAVPGAATS